jgi:Holliday junction DNA helicase RuvA
MIAHVNGTVAEKFETTVIVDVGGVGYAIQAAAGDFEAAKIGDKVKFYTYHHIREQSQELFGFSSLTAKRLFEMLITVQGVGPKAALAILSLGTAETVRNAIAMNDSIFIQRASGVGKRTAERVTVDLKDKVGLPGAASSGGMQPSGSTGRDDALDALLTLGFSLQDAEEALRDVDPKLSVEARVTEALKQR